jgi:hypothetical protein
VFMRTKQGCSRLTRELQRAGIQADAIHGDKSQLERIKALDDFKNGTTIALIATDVAARGLDIDDLPTSSTTNCRTRRKTTCTASAAPVAPARGQRHFAGQRPRSRLSGRYRKADQAPDRAGRSGRFRAGTGIRIPAGQQEKAPPGSVHRSSVHGAPRQSSFQSTAAESTGSATTASTASLEHGGSRRFRLPQTLRRKPPAWRSTDFIESPGGR